MSQTKKVCDFDVENPILTMSILVKAMLKAIVQ